MMPIGTKCEKGVILLLCIANDSFLLFAVGMRKLVLSCFGSFAADRHRFMGLMGIE
jgi:hypothetical protein